MFAATATNANNSSANPNPAYFHGKAGRQHSHQQHSQNHHAFPNTRSAGDLKMAANIAHLWNANNNDTNGQQNGGGFLGASEDSIWKFCTSDYSSLSSSASASPEDHENNAATFLQMASQLQQQRQTPPDRAAAALLHLGNGGGGGGAGIVGMDGVRRAAAADLLLSDHFSRAFTMKPGELENQQQQQPLIKTSLCCAYILHKQCDRGEDCVFAHSIMDIGKPIKRMNGTCGEASTSNSQQQQQ